MAGKRQRRGIPIPRLAGDPCRENTTQYTIIGVASGVLGPSSAHAAEAGTQVARSSIRFVATRNDAIQNMLWMTDTRKDDVV